MEKLSPFRPYGTEENPGLSLANRLPTQTVPCMAGERSALASLRGQVAEERAPGIEGDGLSSALSDLSECLQLSIRELNRDAIPASFSVRQWDPSRPPLLAHSHVTHPILCEQLAKYSRGVGRCPLFSRSPLADNN